MVTKQQMGMIRGKKNNLTLQTNTWHRQEEAFQATPTHLSKATNLIKKLSNFFLNAQLN